MTSLFPDIIFGPVRSRRLGLSLGVNLLPTRSKLCSFDCIYCECGWNAEHTGARRFNDRDDVRTQLEATLRRMVADGTPPDVITFAGNGEPTLHPDFETVIGDTLALRDALCPGVVPKQRQIPNHGRKRRFQIMGKINYQVILPLLRNRRRRFPLFKGMLNRIDCLFGCRKLRGQCDVL